MGLLAPLSVPRGGVLYTMIVPGRGFLHPSSRVPEVCPGGMVMDEIDTCITIGNYHCKPHMNGVIAIQK